MKRIHAFEFEDESWLPQAFRNYITELVQHLLTSASIYRPIAPKLRDALDATGQRHVVDLCSGATGPMVQLHEELGPDVSITLSDKYPNFESFERARRASGGSIDFVEESVDVTAIPRQLRGFRTLFSAFHHFRPRMAAKVLQDAVDQQQPIGVFEFTERRLANFIKIALLGSVLVWLQTPLVRPRRAGRLFWTYVLPVVPLLYCWDAIVSHWRTYTPDELRGFVEGLANGERYEWEIGQLPSNAGFTLTYLIGKPRA